MIEFKNIKKAYKDGTVGISGVNLMLPDKGLILFVGKSGSGKSTLLKLLSGIMEPTEGSILYNGKDIRHIRKYKNIVGNVFQDFNLIKDLNVIDNINFIDKKKTKFLLESLELSKLKQKKVYEISGGEARRVAIARSLNKNVKILLCDEPTESLDRENEERILRVLKEISKDILVVVVSHKESVKGYADRIISVSKAKIIDDIIINEDKTKVNENQDSSSVSVFKLIKIGLFRIFHNFGLFTLNLSSIFFITLLFIISLVLKNTDLDYVEVDAMAEKNNYKLRLVGNDAARFEEDIKKIYPDYSRVYQYFLEDNLLEFDLDYVDEEVGAFYLSVVNQPYVVNLRDKTFLDSDEIVGRIPVEENEVLISEYTFEGFKKFGVKTVDGDYVKYSSIDSVIGEELLLGGKSVIISGILRQDIKTYENLKYSTFIERVDQENYFSMFSNSVAEMNYMYVTSEFEEYMEPRLKNFIGFFVNTKDKEVLYKLKKEYKTESLIAKGIYSDNLGKYNHIMRRLSKVGAILLVVFFILGIVILFNYFSNSIENHEKDNCILKYLGVRNNGILIPYIFEVFVLIVLSFISSLFVFNGIAKTINEFYYELLSSKIDIFFVTSSILIQVLLVLGIVIVFLLIMSIIRVSNSIKQYTE